MKCISIAILLITNINFLIGQITSEDVKPLFSNLSEENYGKANKISKELLYKFGEDKVPIIGIIRYTNLFSGAVLVTEGKMKYKELKEIVEGFKGETLMMAAHPTTIDKSQDVYKYNVLKEENGKITSLTKGSNNENTIVYIFEYFEYDEEFEISEFDKKDTRCRGILKEVKFNKKKSKDWIMKIYLEDTKIHKIN